jgi:hypothetical protein
MRVSVEYLSIYTYMTYGGAVVEGRGDEGGEAAVQLPDTLLYVYVDVSYVSLGILAARSPRPVHVHPHINKLTLNTRP